MYREAVRAIPSIKYAMGVAGIISVAMIINNLANKDPRYAIFGFLAVLIGMFLILMFARAGSMVSDAFKGPVTMIVWSLSVLFIAAVSLSMSAFCFGWPDALAHEFGVIPANIRNTPQGVERVSRTFMEGDTLRTSGPERSESLLVSTGNLENTVQHNAMFWRVREVSEDFTYSDSDQNCAANRTQKVAFCLASGQARVTGWSGPTATSANCNSKFVGVQHDPQRANCVFVETTVRGCGYDNFLGLNNCRGRRWLAGRITLRGIAP